MFGSFLLINALAPFIGQLYCSTLARVPLREFILLVLLFRMCVLTFTITSVCSAKVQALVNLTQSHCKKCSHFLLVFTKEHCLSVDYFSAAGNNIPLRRL
jgi:hypothetical protein